MTSENEFPLALKLALEETISLYNDKKYIKTDPIFFPSSFKNPLDIEIVSLLSCFYAYGNVKAIQKFLSPIFNNLGPSPYEAFAKKTNAYYECFQKISYYRFQTKIDNQNLLASLSKHIQKHHTEKQRGPIFENFFLNQFSKFEPEEGIKLFQLNMERSLMEVSNQKNISKGLRFLIGDPNANSPKKRICLFLRWMVRRSFPDFGIYRQIKTSDLIFPLDVHIQRLIKILGISKRKTYTLKDGIAVKEFFQKLNLDDPLLYDFYLTRVGMIQKCKGVKIPSICNDCRLQGVCLVGSATGN